MGNRRYTSALRADQARLTRDRVLDAARRLFVANGYTATTVGAIAREAAVNVQTVYNTVGNKREALAAVYDATLAGDDATVPIAQRPAFLAVQAAGTATECLARYAALGRQLAERSTPLVAAILAEAGNPEVRGLAETIDRQRDVGSRRVAEHVAERFGLRDDLTIEAASDILWALTSPELTVRLVRHRGWSWDRYEAWLTTAMTASLLDPCG